MQIDGSSGLTWVARWCRVGMIRTIRDRTTTGRGVSGLPRMTLQGMLGSCLDDANENEVDESHCW